MAYTEIHPVLSWNVWILLTSNTLITIWKDWGAIYNLQQDYDQKIYVWFQVNLLKPGLYTQQNLNMVYEPNNWSKIVQV